MNATHYIPHPHLDNLPNIGDRITRLLGSVLPLSVQHHLRDNGTFRSVADSAVTMGVPVLAASNPSVAKKFLALSQEKIRWKYGSHDMQLVDFFLPKGSDGTVTSNPRGILFFVHGGAWGSGKPWMYRLVGQPFLEEANMAVAILGYRTYPDGNVQDQVDDLDAAISSVAMKYPQLVKRQSRDDEWLGVHLMGHSSGTHISLLYLVEMLQQRRMCTDNLKEGNIPQVRFDSFIGLSGVFSISHHYDYEAGRGVEQISPMQPACGSSKKLFDLNSPHLRLRTLLVGKSEDSLLSLSNEIDAKKEELVEEAIVFKDFPPMLLVHGIEDHTVPFTSTSEAARIMKSCGAICKEFYVPKTDHADVVMHFMLDGKSKEFVMKNWVLGAQTGNFVLSSRL